MTSRYLISGKKDDYEVVIGCEIHAQVASESKLFSSSKVQFGGVPNQFASFVDVAILKSVGPDIKKIENTLNLFGPKYEYVIMGYPPFLKNLVDNSIVNWSKYNIIAAFGGEGLSEGMRDYLSKYFKKVIHYLIGGGINPKSLFTSITCSAGIQLGMP